jgi:hypothetical protein
VICLSATFSPVLLKPKVDLVFFRLPRLRSGCPSGAWQRRAPEVSDAFSYPTCSLENLAMRIYDLSPLWLAIDLDCLSDLVEMPPYVFRDGGASND